MITKIINTDKEYNAALDRLDEIFDAKKGSNEENEAQVLVLLIADYEDKMYPIDALDPIEAIKLRMEQMGINRSELASILGYRSRVSEIFNKKRKLSLNMIRSLHEKLNIPYESLMMDY